jgi:hypothetical protein
MPTTTLVERRPNEPMTRLRPQSTASSHRFVHQHSYYHTNKTNVSNSLMIGKQIFDLRDNLFEHVDSGGI